MKKTTYKRLKGSKNFRQRLLLLSTLSSTPIIIEDIRHLGTWPGLRPHEVSLLRLIAKICDDCYVEINETGTKVKYRPGIVIGGRNLVHDCGVSRAVGYFLEPLIVLGLFGKKPISIRLKGITNDSKDPSVDTFRSTTLPMLKRFGIPTEGLDLKIESRGVPPKGGGEDVLTIPILQTSLKAVDWTDVGLVKRIRGTTFSTKVPPHHETTMRQAARGIFNRLLPDVHIFSDHKSGPQAGNSPGFGISLVAETTTGCFISADTAVSYEQCERAGEMDHEEPNERIHAEVVSEQTASALLGEVEEAGVVDLKHQGLLFLLCALCSLDVSKIRVAKLSPYGIETLRNIRDFVGVEFFQDAKETTIFKCRGCGLKNQSRKIS